MPPIEGAKSKSTKYAVKAHYRMLNFEQALSDHSEKLGMYSGARII